MSEQKDFLNELDDLRKSTWDGFRFDREAALKDHERSGADKSGLSLKLLSVIGGIMAGTSFSGFLGAAGLYNSGLAMLSFGLLFIAAAVMLNKKYDLLVMDTFTISLFLIGFLHVAIGLNDFNVHFTYAIFIFMTIAVITLMVNRNYMLSFLSFLIFIGGMLALLIVENHEDWIHLYNLLMVYLLLRVNLNEAAILSVGRRYAAYFLPLRIAIVIGLIMGLMMVVFSNLINIQKEYVWLTSVATIGGILYLVDCQRDVFGITDIRGRIMMLATCLIILSPIVLAPAITGALLIILVAFLVSHNTAFVIGIIFFLYFTGQYYYDMDMTLLKKSLLMMITGVSFLVLYIITRTKLLAHEKE